MYQIIIVKRRSSQRFDTKRLKIKTYFKTSFDILAVVIQEIHPIIFAYVQKNTETINPVFQYHADSKISRQTERNGQKQVT